MTKIKYVAIFSILIGLSISTAKADWTHQDWTSWDSLGIEITNAMGKYAQLKNDNQALVDSIIQFARTDSEKGDFISIYIKQNIITVHSQDSLYANNIEYAFETLQKGEGILIDKAVLAKAMFERAGLMANPVCISKDIGRAVNNPVNIMPFGHIQVWISGEDFEAVYDPSTDIITTGLEPIYGRTIWMPGLDSEPVVRMPSDNEPGEYSVTVDLFYDAKNNKFTGTGLLKATGCMTPYDNMAGLNNESFVFLDSLVSGLFDGARLTSYNITRFDFFNITTGFEFELDANINSGFIFAIGLTHNRIFKNKYSQTATASQANPKQHNFINLYQNNSCPATSRLILRLHNTNFETVKNPDSIYYNSELIEFSAKTTAETEYIRYDLLLNLKDVKFNTEIDSIDNSELITFFKERKYREFQLNLSR